MTDTQEILDVLENQVDILKDTDAYQASEQYTLGQVDGLEQAIDMVETLED